jgi:hypothetical protein
MRTWIALVLGMVLSAWPAWAANTHDFGGNAAREQAAWFGDMNQPFVVSGCVPAVPVPPSLSVAPLACHAYVRATTGELVYVAQDAHEVGPFNAGNGVYWLAVHRNTSSAVAGWTREAATHYVWLKSATAPTVPAEMLLVAQVTVAGAVITASSALAPVNAREAGVSYVSTFVPQYGMTFAAIQAAIDALPPSGGRVIVEPGHYSGATSITIGNGGVGVPSTRHNVFLEGIAPVNHDLSLAATVLTWTGGAQPIIHIKGPIVGWGLKNLYLYGGGTANAGVFVVSGQYGEVSNLVIAGHAGNGIWSSCVPVMPGWNGATDALKNTWDQVWVWHLPPAAAGTAAIALDSTDITCNTDFNTFYQPTVFVAGVDAYGIYLGGADHNMFFDAHIGDDVTTRSDVHLAYNNSAFPGWPCGNNFYGLSLGNRGMTTSGVPHATNFCSNQIFGMTGGDPVDFLPDLPGVQVVSTRRINQNLILIPSRNPAATEPVGNLELYSSPTFVRHFIPTISGVSQLGNSTHQWAGLYQTQRATATNTTLLLSDHTLQVGNPSADTIVLLPSAVGIAGKDYEINNINAFSVFLTPQAGQLIDGQSLFVMRSFMTAVKLISDGVGWHVQSVAMPFEQNVRSVTAATVADPRTDKTLIVTAATPVAVTLPSAVLACMKAYEIKNTTANDVTITPTGGQTINGAATFVLADAHDSVVIRSNCSTWEVISGYGL